jgi:carbon storage regulator
MLVLSRKQNEQIVVEVPASPEPQRIVFTVVDIRGDKVRLGTEASIEVTVHRREIQDLIDAERGAE